MRDDREEEPNFPKSDHVFPPCDVFVSLSLSLSSFSPMLKRGFVFFVGESDFNYVD